MFSLSQILADHGSLLVLDGSGIAQASWFGSSRGPGHSVRIAEEAGIGIFKAVAAVCPRPGQAGAFAFCEAPGSVLGIRIAAAAIRSWTALRFRPVYSYHALQLAAAADASPRTYLADARRGAWHCLIPGQAVRIVATEDLGIARAGMPFVTLEGYRHWEPLPPETMVQPYDIGALLSASPTADLFSICNSPDAALVARPSYAQWTPHIHRRP